MRAPSVTAVVFMLAAASAGSASAQRLSWPAARPVARSIDEVVVAGLGAAATVLLVPADARVREWAVRDPTTHLPIRKLDALFRPMGEHIPLFASAGGFLIGGLAEAEELRDASLMTAESILGVM